MPNLPPRVYASTLDAIGNTPAVRLQKVVEAKSANVFVKLEYFNPTGSYKDRKALTMIEEAEACGDLRPGMRVVEYTGGNTGASLAFVCALKGYKCMLVSSDAYAPEKLQSMVAFGAELVMIPSQGGQITPDLLQSMFEQVRRLAAAEGVYWTNQSHNVDGVKGNEGIGRELLQQVAGPIHAFCAGVGTGAMLMGVARVLRRAEPSTRIVVLEPASSPVISSGVAGSHRIEGIGYGLVPALLHQDAYDEVRGIDEGEARQMARRLAQEEGIFAGTSTGLNVAGALQLARELGPGKTVVTVACGSGFKYLRGDLYAV